MGFDFEAERKQEEERAAIAARSLRRFCGMAAAVAIVPLPIIARAAYVNAPAWLLADNPAETGFVIFMTAGLAGILLVFAAVFCLVKD